MSGLHNRTEGDDPNRSVSKWDVVAAWAVLAVALTAMVLAS